ncbi:MAG: sigma-70 family RNA polymerase sigma factor [Alphaproteobacteria bacterium]|nr:sigma-70 family RNA polymerase sigma factor [Alphaproteobacteria bacterium]
MPITAKKELTEWLARCATGDRAAFSRLYDATSAKLYGVIIRIVRDRARSDDLLQEVYLRIWQRSGSFNPDRASPITWMATIARNAAIDEVRKSARQYHTVDIDVSDVPDATPRADAVIEQSEAWQRLEGCLETLEQDHRSVVKQAYLEGLSREEISTRMKMPVGTVKTWLHRSLKRLKECLAG